MIDYLVRDIGSRIRYKWQWCTGVVQRTGDGLGELSRRRRPNVGVRHAAADGRVPPTDKEATRSVRWTPRSGAECAKQEKRENEAANLLQLSEIGPLPERMSSDALTWKKGSGCKQDGSEESLTLFLRGRTAEAELLVRA